MYRLTCLMVVQAPAADVFRFFEDPRNLEKITPPWLNFRIVDPGSIHMRAGAEIDYVIGWLGIPMRWKTVITEYAPPLLFVDEQERGPYALWRHRHTFDETPGGVAIRDQVDYHLPLGVLGRLAHGLVVKRQLLSIFRFRQREIARLMAVPGIHCTEPSVSQL